MMMRKDLSLWFYCLILKRLLNENQKNLARPILSTLLKKYGIFERRVRMLLVQYLCMDNVDNAFRFLKAMKEKRLSVTFPVIVLKGFMKEGRVLDAYNLIMGATDSLPFLDVVDYSIVVDTLCKGGHMDKALDLCAFAKRKGISLNIFTYNSIINGLCRQGCLVEAFRLFDSLESINMVPSEITYGILIDTLSKGGSLLDARALFERMALRGFKPNTHIYNSLIFGYCKSGQMREALEFFLDLEVKCLKPDDFTISALIYGYCRKGDMEAALGLFFELKEKENRPDFLGFIHLIRGLCSKGRMEESRSILREMLKTQSVVNMLSRVDSGVEMESVKCFLDVLCEQGRILEAISILDEVASLFFPLGWRPFDCSKSENLKLHDGISGIIESKALMCSNKNDLDIESCDVPNFEKSVITNTDLDDMRPQLPKFDFYNVEGVEKLVKNCADLDDKRSRLPVFDSFYALTASLCSRGELGKANELAKMLFSCCEGCQ